jgi:hypothetical protein
VKEKEGEKENCVVGWSLGRKADARIQTTNDTKQEQK